MPEPGGLGARKCYGLGGSRCHGGSVSVVGERRTRAAWSPTREDAGGGASLHAARPPSQCFRAVKAPGSNALLHAVETLLEGGDGARGALAFGQRLRIGDRVLDGLLR